MLKQGSLPLGLFRDESADGTIGIYPVAVKPAAGTGVKRYVTDINNPPSNPG
jgi:hypothetical protein